MFRVLRPKNAKHTLQNEISGTDSYVFGVEEPDFQGPEAQKLQKL